MTGHQTILPDLSRAQPGGHDVRGPHAYGHVPFFDGFADVTARDWPMEPVRCPAATRTGSIPRIEGGQMLPPELRGAIVALGNFDGFHVGHQAVVDRAVERARRRGVAAIVATFDPHPVRHFAPDIAPFRLTTLDQRQRLFARAGVDAMMVFHFDGALASITPEEFVLHWLPGVGGVVTGDGFTFGRRRAGTVQVFSELASAQGMTYEAVDRVSAGGERVSSTRIRTALRQGDCATVKTLLSRPFAISGNLRPDDGLDPQRGLPFASIDMEGYLRPHAGFYRARARFAEGCVSRCTAYVGPSAVAGSEDAGLCLTARDWKEEMHGRPVDVELVEHLSNAERFTFQPL